MTSINIRQLTITDAPALVELYSELERFYFPEYASSPVELLHYLQHGLLDNQSSMTTVAAVQGGQLVAFASYVILYPAPRRAGQMYMKELFVTERCRGQRLGQRLISHLAGIAIDAGCRRLDWTAETSNPKAGAFYRTIGAELVTEKEYFRFADEALSQVAAAAFD